MRKSNKAWAYLLVAVLLISALPQNVSALSWADAKMSCLVENKILDGMPDNPDRKVTREEFGIIISKAFYKSQSENVELPFEDLHEISEEAIPYLAALYENNILTGSLNNGIRYMNPNSGISRQDAATLAGKIISESSSKPLNFTDNAAIASYAYEYISRLVEIGVLHGNTDGSFKPLAGITIAEVSSMVCELLEYKSLNAKLSQAKLETFLGTGNAGNSNGGILDAAFNIPQGICLDKKGNLVVFDTYNALIRTVNNKRAETLLGAVVATDDYGFAKGFYLDAGADKALFSRPVDGVYNSQGELFIADSENHAIRYLSGNRVYTFSGSSKGFSDGSSKTTKFNFPAAIAIDSQDNLYVTDTFNNVIRKIDKHGNSTTLAGVPGKSGFLDGGSDIALFNEPSGIAIDKNGAVYVSDTGNHRIRKIENGEVTTVAGSATAKEAGEEYEEGGYKDGESPNALFKFPKGLCFAGDTLVIADSGNHIIRALTKGGRVMTLAGTSEPGDIDGISQKAQMNKPTDVLYAGGQLYIADSLNNKIKVMPIDMNSIQ